MRGSGDDARLWLYPGGGREPLHVRVACAAGGGKVTADVHFERCAL